MGTFHVLTFSTGMNRIKLKTVVDKFLVLICTIGTVVGFILVRASDQNIIERQGILMQIYLLLTCCGFNIVLFTNKHTVTNMSVHRSSADERLILTDTRP